MRSSTPARLRPSLTSCAGYRLLRLSAPIIEQNVLQYSLVVISIAFVGHLGDPTIMSGAVLAGSFFNVSGYSVLIGLAGAMDTLCGQVRSTHLLCVCQC